MSMTVITALQLVGIFCAYLIITVVGPHLVIGKTLRFRNAYERFMLYSMFGNFYVMNLVYLLEMLHISHPITLFLFTVVPCAIIKIKLEHIPFKENLSEKWDILRRLTGGQLKYKNFIDQTRPIRKERRKRRFKKIRDVLLKNLPDIAITGVLLACIFWVYGYTLLEIFGYRASDLVVHTYWINELSENNIFCAGVYPFGFHNVYYYIHSIFRIDTYVLLRLGGLISATWIILMILCFLKLLCKSRFLPYIGAFLYTIVDCFEYHTYSRLSAPLPQEYGIMFILPAIYCGFWYFREQRREKRGSYAKKSYMYLAGFAMSFSMALTVHFYGVMVAGIYSVAMAIGFIGWFLRKDYFKKVILTVIISLVIAVLPMVIAAATGTKLQGSLGWGLSVMFGSGESSSSGTTGTSQGTTASAETEEPAQEVTNFSKMTEKYSEKYGPVVGRAIAIVNIFESTTDYASIKTDNPAVIYGLLASFGVMIPVGLIFLLGRKDRIYGAMILSTGLFMIFMLLVVGAGNFGLLRLMDLNRGSIYFSYCVTAAISLCLDSVLYLFLGFPNKRIVINIASFMILAASAYYVIKTGNIRNRFKATEAMERNEAVECLTKIIAEEKDYKWTICSANDEGRMVYGHGFHYELVDFLRGMEYVGSRGKVRIPTEHVYFFVEKIPIDYFAPYEGSGQSISEEGARMYLPVGRALSLYMGRNRWVFMSRLYYWGQKFMELYPNETSVYYENENFICYRVEQNPYRLFNFAVDYGYNNIIEQSE